MTPCCIIARDLEAMVRSPLITKTHLNTHTHTHTHTHIVINDEGVGLWLMPRDAVVGRGVVAGCTRISSQEYVHEK